MDFQGSGAPARNADSKLFVQWLSGPRWRETGWHEVTWVSGKVGRLPKARVPYVRPPGFRAQRVLGGLGVTLKQSARLIYVSPLLIIAKIALQSVNRVTSDLVTVAFVLLVVAFFALLNAYLLLAALVFFARRGGHRAVRPATLGARALMRSIRWPGNADVRSIPVVSTPDGAESGTVMRVVGTLASITGTAGRPTLVRDAWCERRGHALRVVEVHDFAVVPAEGPPVVLQCRAAPTLVAARSAKRPTEQALAELPLEIRGLLEDEGALPSLPDQIIESTLSEGDLVTLVGVFSCPIPDVEQFEIEGRIRSLADGAPRAPAYRQRAGRPGLLFECAPGRPALILQAPHTL